MPNSARFIRPQTGEEVAAALAALDRLYDQARNTAGSDEGRKRCYDDLCAISRSIPDPLDPDARYDGTYDPKARYE